MQIVINDQPRDVDDGITIAGLLRQLEMKSQYVAVERNLELVPRARHAECVLQPYDRVEIVTLVGGG